MSIALQPEPLPMEMDRDGVIRIAGTRVTLETVVAAFLRGATAEEISQDYPSVPLSDVYGVISYYLRHRAEVDEYINQQRLDFEEARRKVEASRGVDLIRERLLARREKRQ